MTSFAPFKLAEDLCRARLDFGADTFKCMALASSYTASKSQTHNRRSDFTSFEVSGTGYTAGGVAATISSAVLTSNEFIITFNNPSWSAPAGPGWTPHWLVFYKSRGGAASADEVIGVVDVSGVALATNGTTFTLQLTSPLKVSVAIGV